jgi:hypothetical protein
VTDKPKDIAIKTKIYNTKNNIYDMNSFCTQPRLTAPISTATQ